MVDGLLSAGSLLFGQYDVLECTVVSAKCGPTAPTYTGLYCLISMFSLIENPKITTLSVHLKAHVYGVDYGSGRRPVPKIRVHGVIRFSPISDHCLCLYESKVATTKVLKIKINQ